MRAYQPTVWTGLTLVQLHIGNCEALTALAATRGQHLATVYTRHTVAKTVLVAALSIGWLEGSFHDSSVYGSCR